ncbi:LysR family transcriptional regulator [Micrococcaceae bacterium RIT802]|nr:LysR family transcriptional regulator [Micrococcaceae bacterium RIT 802]
MPLYDPALRYFLAVFESGSINAAARQLHVAGSAVSRQISRLEKEVGSVLFERLPSGVVATESGDMFAGFARRVIQDAGHVVDEIHERRGAESLISIAAPSGVGHEFLPRIAADYRKIHTGTWFVLKLTEPATATQMVRDGATDVAVTFNLAIDAGVKIIDSRPAPLMAVVRAGHPLACESSIRLRELLSYPLALSAPNTTNRHLFDVVVKSASRGVEPVFVCDNPDALLSFVRQGDAVTLMGRITTERDLAAGDVVAIPLKEKELGQRNLQVQTKAGRELPAALADFIDFLVAALGATEV